VPARPLGSQFVTLLPFCRAGLGVGGALLVSSLKLRISSPGCPSLSRHMLYSIDSTKYIKDVPHAADFKRWRGRLSEAEFSAIADELTDRIDGGEIHTSSWMPGNNWEGTVFDPIYQKAKCLDQLLARRHAEVEGTRRVALSRYLADPRQLGGASFALQSCFKDCSVAFRSTLTEFCPCPAPVGIPAAASDLLRNSL
jgi:hypothetical protein